MRGRPFKRFSDAPPHACTWSQWRKDAARGRYVRGCTVRGCHKRETAAVHDPVPVPRVPHACYSKPGWWQTLCGRDSANQGFGWTSDVRQVGCDDCRRLNARGDHLRRPKSAVLKPRRAVVS